MLTLDTNVRGVVAYRPIGQMPPKQDSRKRIVQTALKLFATRGYYNTSIADILRESSCKRGSLYHYFSSKEELGYAVIDEAMRLLAEEGAGSSLYTSGHPIDRLLKMVDALPTVARPGAKGASASDVAIHMAAVHEGFRKRLGESMGAMVERAEEMVRKGVADGQIADSVDPEQLAHVVATMGAGIQLDRLLWERDVIWKDAKGWLKDYLNSLRK